MFYRMQIIFPCLFFEKHILRQFNLFVRVHQSVDWKLNTKYDYCREIIFRFQRLLKKLIQDTSKIPLNESQDQS